MAFILTVHQKFICVLKANRICLCTIESSHHKDQDALINIRGMVLHVIASSPDACEVLNIFGRNITIEATVVESIYGNPLIHIRDINTGAYACLRISPPHLSPIALSPANSLISSVLSFPSDKNLHCQSTAQLNMPLGTGSGVIPLAALMISCRCDSLDTPHVLLMIGASPLCLLTLDCERNGCFCDYHIKSSGDALLYGLHTFKLLSLKPAFRWCANEVGSILKVALALREPELCDDFLSYMFSRHLQVSEVVAGLPISSYHAMNNFNDDKGRCKCRLP
jgi:hypothetical protein